MNNKTSAEYEALKSAWLKLPGVVEDSLQHSDSENVDYRYLTLTDRVPRDLAMGLGALMRLGTLAVQTGAYLTMVVFDDEVRVKIAVRCDELPAPDVAADVAREMLGLEVGKRGGVRSPSWATARRAGPPEREKGLAEGRVR